MTTIEFVLLSALVVLVASVLTGVVGFAFGLITLPLLLLLGMPLADVVFANLTIGSLTRVFVIRTSLPLINRRRAGLLMAGSLPGIGLGVLILHIVSAPALQLGAGIFTLVTVVALVRQSTSNPTTECTTSGTPLITLAGLFGGFLGPTVGLSGVVPALLLSRDRVHEQRFKADLAAYFLVGNVLTLALLMLNGYVPPPELLYGLAAWMPTALLGEYAGNRLIAHVSRTMFSRITLGLISVSGFLSILQVV